MIEDSNDSEGDPVYTPQGGMPTLNPLYRFHNIKINIPSIIDKIYLNIYIY